MTTNVTFIAPRPVRPVHPTSSFAPRAVASATSTHTHTRLRMTRRGRRFLVALIVIPAILAIVWAALNGGGADAASWFGGTDLTYVTVHQGESLWDIAQREAPGLDVRTYVDELIHLNNLQGDIQPGQRIALP